MSANIKIYSLLIVSNKFKSKDKGGKLPLGQSAPFSEEFPHFPVTGASDPVNLQQQSPFPQASPFYALILLFVTILNIRILFVTQL